MTTPTQPGTPGTTGQLDFFIIGCGRSGTTLLRAMLNSHPDLAIPPESYFVMPLLSRQASFCPAPEGVRLGAVRQFLVDSGSFAEWQLDISAVDAAWEARPPVSLADAIGAVYRAYACEHGKQLVGDKTPHHARHLDLLASSFPRARFVHLIRDGRAVGMSLKRAPFGPRTFLGGVEQWRRDVSAGLEGRRLLADRYEEVRYEDLVADSPTVLRAVCDFLDVRYDPAMLDYHRRADEMLRGVRVTEHLRNIAKPPTPSALPDLTRLQAQQFAAAAGPLLPYASGASSASSLAARASVVANRSFHGAHVAWRRVRSKAAEVRGHRPIDRAVRAARPL